MNFTLKRIFITLVIIIGSQSAFADLHRGVSLGLTNRGTGLNYVLAYNYSPVLQMNISAGLHFEKKDYDFVIYNNGISENTKKLVTYLPVSVGFSKVLFNDALAGTFRPLIYGEGSVITGLGRFKDLTSNAYEFSTYWSIGPGVQFGYGKSMTQIIVAYTSNKKVDGSILIKLSLFWK